MCVAPLPAHLGPQALSSQLPSQPLALRLRLRLRLLGIPQLRGLGSNLCPQPCKLTLTVTNPASSKWEGRKVSPPQRACLVASNMLLWCDVTQGFHCWIISPASPVSLSPRISPGSIVPLQALMLCPQLLQLLLPTPCIALKTLCPGCGSCCRLLRLSQLVLQSSQLRCKLC